ncbi:hypothetical protein ACHAWX_000786 [Stephanocyclus meneghinianus]
MKGREDLLDQSLISIQAFLSENGGVSRMTMFNNQWHAKHQNAARPLRGYNSWAKTKLYLGAYYPDEVDTNYDPSKMLIKDSSGAYQLPYLTPFEECLIC